MVTKIDVVDGPTLQSLWMIKDTDSKEAIINSMARYIFRVTAHPIAVTLFSKMSPLLDAYFN